jgi:hypothetical protein
VGQGKKNVSTRPKGIWAWSAQVAATKKTYVRDQGDVVAEEYEQVK